MNLKMEKKPSAPNKNAGTVLKRFYFLGGESDPEDQQTGRIAGIKIRKLGKHLLHNTFRTEKRTEARTYPVKSGI